MNSQCATEAADQLLAESADPARAAAMAGYLKHQFSFYGVPAPQRRSITAPLLNATRSWSGGDVLAFAESCWQRDHREVLYVGLDVVMRRTSALSGADDLSRVEQLIRSQSWWDTVDLLAAHPVGDLVLADRALAVVMDDWVADDDMWIARSAILHQLSWGEDTDVDRLFGYVDRHAGSKEFFIRKACGWALRTYARTDPVRVRGFVESRRDRLSGLTVREALKHLH